MFTVKLISFMDNGQTTEVFQTETYKVNEDKGIITLHAQPVGWPVENTYRLIYDSKFDWHRAIVMNENGKTVDLIKTYPKEV